MVHLLPPVSCLTFPVSHLLSHASCLTFPVSRLLSNVSCLTSPVSRLLSHVSCLKSPVLHVLSLFKYQLISELVAHGREVRSDAVGHGFNAWMVFILPKCFKNTQIFRN